MRIAVNGKSLATQDRGGAVRVALSVIRHVALLDPQTSLHVYAPVARGSDPAFDLPDNVCVHPIPAGNALGGVGKAVWEQVTLPFLVRRDGPYDLLINLTNSAPVLYAPGIPQVLLLHDAGFVRQDWFSSAYSRYLSGLTRLAITHGIHIATVSATSAAQLRTAFPRLGHITVIPNGIDEPPKDVAAHAPPYPYVLFLGSLNPRKNLKGAIEGFRLFSMRTGGNVRLLVAGAEKQIFVQEDKSGWTDQVTFLGYVDEARKWALLKGASALLLPSFLEGFGLPVAEAIKVNTPVVISDIPIFRELFGDVPEYVDPHSPGDIARGIAAVLERHRSNAGSRSDDQILAQYTWTNAARLYMELFQKIAAPTPQLHKVF